MPTAFRVGMLTIHCSLFNLVEGKDPLRMSVLA